MMRADELRLVDYRPVSELIVEEHHIEKPRFPVIDFHMHFGGRFRHEFYEKRYGTRAVCKELRGLGVVHGVDLSIFAGEPFDRQLNKTKPEKDFLTTFAPIDMATYGIGEFEEDVKRQFTSYDTGRVAGIKIWKELTMGMRDRDGHYISLAAPGLQVIWEEAASRNWPVLIHVADPTAFFKPIDGSNERFEELAGMARWNRAGDPELSFLTLVEQMEKLIAENPETTFVIAHMGAWPTNLRQVGAWLDMYPNMYVDTAACLQELGRQPYSAGDFFRRYADRILFGTDLFAGDRPSHRLWYRFLETRDEYFSYDNQNPPACGRWNIYGIGLEDEVLRKIYYENACRLLRLDAKQWHGLQEG